MERLPDSLAAQVLQRASEIDASGQAGTSILDLRQAALAAGISAHAFDRALAEVQQQPVGISEIAKPPVRAAHRGFRFIGMFTILMLALLIPLAFLSRTGRSVRENAGPTMVDAIIELRCLSPSDAGLLLRPLFPKGKSSMSWSDRAPRELRIHSTATQIRLMREKVAEVEGDAATVCTLDADGVR